MKLSQIEAALKDRGIDCDGQPVIILHEFALEMLDKQYGDGETASAYYFFKAGWERSTVDKIKQLRKLQESLRSTSTSTSTSPPSAPAK